jgi:hypothetical protein
MVLVCNTVPGMLPWYGNITLRQEYDFGRNHNTVCTTRVGIRCPSILACLFSTSFIPLLLHDNSLLEHFNNTTDTATGH